MTETPWLFTWRSHLMSADGPPFTRRMLLLALSTYGDERGRDIFPSTREVARATGMTRKRVGEHLRKAAEEGWLQRRSIGQGQGWRRMRYRLTLPDSVGRGVGATPPSEDVGSERPRVAPGGRGVVRDPTRGRSRPNAGSQRPLTPPLDLSIGPPQEAASSQTDERPDATGGGFWRDLSPSGPTDTDTDAPTAQAVGEGPGVALAVVEPLPEPNEPPDRMRANELIAHWVENSPAPPPQGERGKQGAAAKRICAKHPRADVVQAAVGIKLLFPHSEGEPWDLFDLERKFAKAHAAAMSHPVAIDERMQRLDLNDPRWGGGPAPHPERPARPEPEPPAAATSGAPSVALADLKADGLDRATAEAALVQAGVALGERLTLLGILDTDGPDAFLAEAREREAQDGVAP